MDDLVEYVYEWPDGTWCFKDELWEMQHMSDDFIKIPYDEERHR